ncbi:Hemerythrin HHE cation binding domain-containing protein [Roseivivax lentus]|uniref:Hemerythrin HHE cation binding domain-containing protein n=1 Tax=Roseivivax lentus TaxID=633194 RepID=A0A1N7NUV8_9RHOB|nr:hemerythrin domain-containing protein [Roseivivax lentus]SIT02091.1 Hemerythrin HHE cation binding domain-containing protein [Roseivivax lentus]
MSEHAQQGLRPGQGLSPTHPALLAQPLDYLHEEHLRERRICVELDALAATGAPDADIVAGILAYLRDELPLHLEDEEDDLFPLLRRRCAPEDEIGKAIARLASDHRHTDKDIPLVIAALTRLAEGGSTLSPQMRGRFARFVTDARRHLILENAIILPFARLRLTAQDLETLRLCMMQRRGLARSMEEPDAQ